MNKIGNYGMYQNNSYDTGLKRTNGKKQKKTEKTEKEGKTKGLQLSEQAKQLLQKLKKMYGDTDFIIADYDSEEEAAAYLARGTKEYSVLIEPEVLEQMAADSETEEKYTSMIQEARAKLTDMSEQLGQEGKNVKQLGVSIGQDGTLTFFAELEKAGEQQKQQLEKSREKHKKEEKLEEKRQKKKLEEEAIQEKKQRLHLQADSIEELMEKIKSVDWDQVPDEKEETGARINYTV